MSKEAMKQALEALEYTTNLSRFLLNDEANIGPMLKADEAITSLRQAIAEAEKQKQSAEHVGEPVAWMMLNSSGDEISITESNLRHHQPAFVQELWKDATPLCTTPQQRKPLTEFEKDELINKHTIWSVTAGRWVLKDFDLIDAVEAAHGITSATDFKE